ncbi:hypothetical protein C6501_04920 [Candidatus Poribacteria bacterium]|nr:MAG: hypothetical protein C6501_04920 [Candidatus Poribacteria bacterium]
MALIICIGGGLLIGANAIKSNTKNPPPCMQRIQPDCIKDMPEPVCPPQQERVPCPLDAIQHHVPCPLDAIQHYVPCPLDTARQRDN